MTPEDLEGRLGHPFSDRGLLERALTHASAAHEKGARSNERLEFLGDAVLGLLVADLLLAGAPASHEGELSRMRAAVVSGARLAPVAESLGLPAALRLGRGEMESGGAGKPTILAGAMEAILGAVFLDGGLAAARQVVTALFGEAIEEEIARGSRGDPKTSLQEKLQADGRPTPDYRLLAQEGPAHAPRFEIEVRSGETVLGNGQGGSKREAESAAAAEALRHLSAASISSK